MSENRPEAKYLSPRQQLLSWSELSGISPTQIYPAGVELFRQGEPAQYVYFLEKGLVKTRYTDANGQELIVSLFGSPGSIVGASCAILDKHCVTATVLCRSYVRFLPASLFRDLLRSDARVSWRIHQLHCRILSEQITQRIQFGCLPARKRFEQLLWQLICALDTKPVAGGVKLQLPLKYWEIAQLIVVTPEHLCRIVKSLENEGLLSRSKGWMIVPDPNKLWRGTDANLVQV